MENKKSNRERNQDRSKVAAGQDYEVNYEKDKLRVSGKEVKNAVKSVGNSVRTLKKN